MRSSSIILKYFKHHWSRYVIGITLVILSTYLNTLIPKYLGSAIDELNSENIIVANVQNIAIYMIVISLLAFVTRFIWRYLILGFCRQIEFYLRENLFSHLQKLSADYYQQNNTGDLITRAIVDVQAVRMMLGFATVAIIDAIVISLLSIMNMISYTNTLLALLAITPIPFLLYLIIRVRLIVRNRFTKVQEVISNITTKAQENITGIRVLKAFSQEEEESVTFSNLSLDKVNAEIKLAKAFAIITPSVGLTFGIVFSVFLVIGGYMVANQMMTLGDYVAFNSYLLLIITPISNIGRIVDRWQRGIASMKRLDSIFKSHPTINDENADLKIVNLKTGEILVDNLSFSYDDNKPIFKNLNFSVPSGGSIAIMGPTGSGKSTITNLLTRVWGCENNMIFIDGKDINTFPLKVLRTNCAYVPQESFLFSDTIMENIRFYDNTITDDEVIAAATIAGVHNNIMELQSGYNTVVGERGMTLSGGQKQRITLARALVKNPKILLLDDCLSAVDSTTEKVIIENLKTQIQNSTTVIVTHRLSAAALADQILILNEDGSLDEIGTHDFLINKGGTYSKMFESMQMNDSALKEEGGCDA